MSQPLLTALSAGRGDIISLVGGGGKTSLALRLVAEAAAAGLRAIFTVTTQIYPPEGLPVLFGVPAAEAALPGAAPGSGPWVVVRGHAPEGKLAGLSPADVARLAPLCDLVVVEADGSRGLPLKFPLAHEPVIPPVSTLVVPVAGASVVGQALTDAHVHRAQAAADFLGVPPGTAITPAMVATILWRPEGATRGRPAGARVIPAINQADSPERLAAAREIGMALRELGTPRVLLTAAQNPETVIATLS